MPLYYLFTVKTQTTLVPDKIPIRISRGGWSASDHIPTRIARITGQLPTNVA